MNYLFLWVFACLEMNSIECSLFLYTIYSLFLALKIHAHIRQLREIKGHFHGSSRIPVFVGDYYFFALFQYKKLYSYSDRCRYYLPDAKIRAAMDRLLSNTAKVPHALISQYFPRQYEDVLSGTLADDGTSLVLARLGNWNDCYFRACGTEL